MSAIRPAAGADSRAQRLLKFAWSTTLGYPTDVYIDYNQRLADEEAGYALANLAPERD